jgi:hypothetical protein
VRGIVSIALLVVVFLGKGEFTNHAFAAESVAGNTSDASTLFLTRLPLSLSPAVLPEAPAEAPVAEPEPNRASCAAISGTDYLSLSERNWFIANCMSAAAQLRLGSVTVAATPVGVSVMDQFIEGYRAAGGPEGYLDRIVTRVIPCESGGNPSAYSSAGPFYGLMQFHGPTWAAMGGGDWRDPYQQGANTARLVQRANPAYQWPVCWNR